ncbi:MAG: hypothetical protein KAH12_00265, partial [Anaerolineales bacterium]|nr:hypothetical protein [Anaerolineales bacterium]
MTKTKKGIKMRRAIFMLLVGTLSLAARAENSKVKNGRWSKERANEWFSKQPWPCGFNYIPANAISYTEMWMPYCFNPELIDKELALAEEVGFN